MRKFAYIFLGLALLIGAGGLFYQRHLSVSAMKNYAAPSRGLPHDGVAGTRSLRRSRAPAVLAKRALFGRALDVLNLIVGVVGIWFSISGMKMQRAAAKAMSLRDDQ